MPGAGSELFQADAQALTGAARPTQGSGQSIYLTLAGAGEYLGGQFTLAAKVAVQTTGGDADIVGQRLHGQGGETALSHPQQGAVENTRAQRLVAVESSFGGAISHGLNPNSTAFSESGFRP